MILCQKQHVIANNSSDNGLFPQTERKPHQLATLKKKSACVKKWQLVWLVLTLMKVNTTFMVLDTSVSSLLLTPHDPDTVVTLGSKFISSYF